jgi:sulfide:quinone oxidoreductase
MSPDISSLRSVFRLAEFKYGGVPKETFAPYLGSQDKPSMLYYYLKKDFFPYVYWNSFVKGTWFGPKGFVRPINYMAA